MFGPKRLLARRFLAMVFVINACQAIPSPTPESSELSGIENRHNPHCSDAETADIYTNPECCVPSIAGYVFVDSTNGSALSKNMKLQGLRGVDVSIALVKEPQNNSRNTRKKTWTTAAGLYEFSGLTLGEYQIEVKIPPNYHAITENQFVLTLKKKCDHLYAKTVVLKLNEKALPTPVGNSVKK